MGNERRHDTAQVDAQPGVVREVKPDGSPVEMTPEAAVETAARLLEGAAKADGRGKLDAEAHARGQKG